MPFKSQAQRRKFAELLVQGKISNETFEEWNRETGGAKLPERVKPKRKTKRAAGGKGTYECSAGVLKYTEEGTFSEARTRRFAALTEVLADLANLAETRNG